MYRNEAYHIAISWLSLLKMKGKSRVLSILLNVDFYKNVTITDLSPGS